MLIFRMPSATGAVLTGRNANKTENVMITSQGDSSFY